MSFSRPTLTQLTDRISADFQTRITGASTLLRRSTLKVIARVLAGVFHLMYGFLEFISKQLFASSSDQAYLDRIASEYGIVRIAGTRASGEGLITGTNDEYVPIGTVLQSASGQRYITTILTTIAGGTATLLFEAEDAGSDGNDVAGISLSFITPLSGISSACTVDVNGITGGADIESDESLRARVLSRKRLPPHGGSKFDYVNWAREVPGVTRAWCFPEYAGVGTVALAFVRDGDVPIIPDAAERLAVEDYLIEHTDPGTGLTMGIPVTAQPGFSVLDVTAYVVNFNIDIYPNTTAVKADIQAALEDLISTEGGPGETLYISKIRQYISNAIGEGHHRLNIPAADVAASQIQVHTLGVITWGDY